MNIHNTSIVIIIICALIINISAYDEQNESTNYPYEDAKRDAQLFNNASIWGVIGFTASSIIPGLLSLYNPIIGCLSSGILTILVTLISSSQSCRVPMFSTNTKNDLYNQIYKNTYKSEIKNLNSQYACIGGILGQGLILSFNIIMLAMIINYSNGAVP